MNVRWFLAAVYFVMAGLGVRLYYLQVLKGEYYRGLSENNRIRKVATVAPRGRIYDRNGVLLVENRPAFDVALLLEDVQNLDETLKQIAFISGSDIDQLKGTLEREKKRKLRFQPLTVLADADIDVVSKLKSRSYKLPGLVIEATPVRDYPYLDLFTQVLGFVREISPEELSKRYRAGDLIGKTGLEQVYEPLLRGDNGSRLIEVDSLGRNRGFQHEVPRRPGKDIVLTIDSRLQKAAQQALGEHKGAVVAMNPKTGEVLVLLSKPALKADFFSSYIEPESWKRVLTDKSKPLENRAIHRLYPPGSTMKLFTALAGLGEGLVTKDTKVNCKGSFRLGRARFRCHKAEGHGVVDLRQALAQSCNVYFYELGEKLGVERLARYLGLFGFGERPGLELPGEEPGFLPTPDWKMKRFNDKWYKGETISLSIGQGFLSVTPLQLARAVSALVNGGKLPKPFITQKTIDPVSEESEVLGKPELQELKIDQSLLRLVTELSEEVVAGERGTGRRARIEGLRIGGKTGTAQVVSAKNASDELEKLKDHALFVSYAPIEDPEIVVVVVVENAGEGGGVAAAPVAKEILSAYFS